MMKLFYFIYYILQAKKIIKWDSEEEYNRVPDFW